MIDDELIQLYKKHRASNLSEYRLFVELMASLEGEEVQRERALALVYELRDRSEAFDHD